IQGEYAFPCQGGWPSAPLLCFSHEKPWVVQDNTEVFWDPTTTDKDEVNKTAPGILRKANGGVRYQLGQWPTSEPDNDVGKSIYTSDKPIGPSITPPPHDEDGHTHPGD